MYGVHAMQLEKPEHVMGKHNKHLEQMLRLTADEALFVWTQGIVMDCTR